LKPAPKVPAQIAKLWDFWPESSGIHEPWMQNFRHPPCESQLEPCHMAAWLSSTADSGAKWQQEFK